MSGSSDVTILYDPVVRMLCPHCRNRMDVSGVPAFKETACLSCKRMVSVPARLGSFLLMELLGTGGMGGVYRAHDETLGRDVAIKVMLKTLGDNPEFVQTFRREAQAAAKLNHPHIAQIYSFGQEKGQPYIVMELVGGKHFDSLISAGSPLDPPLVMRIGTDIAEGLKEAAAVGLVHGDIKPENILLDEHDQAKLVDFGLAGNVNQSQGEIWGTPYYIAPEKVRRQRIDHRSDIYCLGGTLYHALAGKPPFDGPDALAVVKARFNAPPEHLSQARPGIDPEIVGIIHRMLQQEPAMRYPTYESLLGDMRRYLSRVGTVPSASGTRRIVIKTRKGGSTDRANDAGKRTTSRLDAKNGRGKLKVSRGMTVDLGQQAAAIAASGGVEQTPAAAAAKPRRRGLKILVWTAVLGAVATGAIWGGIALHRRRSATGAAQIAAASLTAAHQAAATALLRIQDLHTNLQAAALQAAAITNDAVRVALTGLEVSWRDRLIPSEPPPAPPAAVETAGSNAPPQAAVPEPAAAVAEADLPPLAVRARAVFASTKPVFEAVLRADQALATAQRIRGAAAATNDTAAIRKAADDIAGIANPLETDVERVPGWLKSAREKLAELQRSVDSLAAERAREAEAQRLAAEEKRKEEERKRLAAEKEAKRDAELTRVREAETAQAEILRKHQYREALRTLRETGDALQTEEGKAALALAIERVQRLEELKTWMVERLAAGDFRSPAGWAVQGADNRNLKVDGKDISWDKVGERQMVPFIQFYLLDENRARPLKLRERVRQSINAALYCVAFGGGSQGSKDMAARLVETAVGLFEEARPDADRLLPDLPRK
jgi:hypothetical protein